MRTYNSIHTHTYLVPLLNVNGQKLATKQEPSYLSI